MHDLDRTQLEMEWEMDSYGDGEYEFDEYEFDEYEYEDEFDADPELYGEAYDEAFGEIYDEFESPFDEAEEMELAADLLEITDEDELDLFLGKVFKKASRAVRRRIPKSVRRRLGGMLKGVARRYLPVAGAALGNIVAPGIGGIVGGKLASVAGRAFGLELEGLSPEDQEFEVARRFVRLAGDAAKSAASTPPTGAPQAMARQAVAAAAQKHAPGLAGAAAMRTPAATRTPAAMRAGARRRGRRGIWRRQGRRIVLYGVFR